LRCWRELSVGYGYPICSGIDLSEFVRCSLDRGLIFLSYLARDVRQAIGSGERVSGSGDGPGKDANPYKSYESDPYRLRNLQYI
jgi:hypothetical protein